MDRKDFLLDNSYLKIVAFELESDMLAVYKNVGYSYVWCHN